MTSISSKHPDTSLPERILLYMTSLVLLLLSVVLFRERIAFADTAAYLVHIMTRDTFEISMNSRFVGGLTQILPYLAFKAGWSLKTIMVLYSLNFILIPITCIAVSVSWFKETRTAWSILLFYTLMSIYMFYYPVSEYQVGLCLFLFYTGLYAHYQTKKNTLVFTLLSILLIPSVIFSHPLSLLVFFCWIILQLCHQPKQKITLLILSIIAIVTAVVKKLFFSIWYEEGKTSALQNFEKFSFSDLHQKMGKSFATFLIQDYFLMIVLLLITILILIIQRKRLLAFLLPAVIAGWWVLVTVSFMDGRYDHYYEHMYQAIPFFIAWGYCTIVFPSIAARWNILLIALTMTISFGKIYNGRKANEERFAWMNRCFTLMDDLNCKKAIFTNDFVPYGNNMPASWSVPYESLLISSLEQNSQSKVLLIKGNLADAARTKDEVLDIDNVAGFPLAPQTYFKIAGEKYCIPEQIIPAVALEAAVKSSR